MSLIHPNVSKGGVSAMLSGATAIVMISYAVFIAQLKATTRNSTVGELRSGRSGGKKEIKRQ